ncbi:MAG: Solitary outer membrane autotransporter beta-barrel domain [Desulfarculaceae bacterium]|nr:Solitary outer membrane autotransporter beta-barrel domain [Desulfarculaceae bacterium]MCF8073548.1 Solitary outer membrane autotransporter beta-barrel domain [Desulfarculaceae bacterium]MCF8103070.1 Solitary outer membrane autotransporter beta-barrel domain [Desulfarculaceae bacterium]MCF8115736.1 Solitary outer membrane autotransporter beta-barrel domain [Desulfarculaceae bacterium]
MLGYLDAKESVDTVSPTFGEQMRWNADWKGYSGMLEGGMSFDLGHGFHLTPGLTAGLARLRNSATFLNDFSKEVVGPVLDGLTTNFSVTALTLSGILAAGYATKLGSMDLEVLGKYTHSYIESIETDNDAQEFNSDIDSVSGRLTVGGPLGVSLGSYPMIWQAFLGGMHFIGQDQEALGWTYYGELGASIGLDIRQLGWPLSALRLGASIIQGDNISGWSIVVGYKF